MPSVRAVEPILHVSLPVLDLPAALAFYVDVLGCERGRGTERATDVWFLGLQLTLHELPDQVLPDQGVRHFGATLDRAAFDALCVRIAEHGVPWLREPGTRNAGTPTEETKALLADPAGNVIELKSYADLAATVLSTDSYA
jgi:extradiol dioxygenase family protein